MSKVSVTSRALIQRINRAIAAKDEILKKSRGAIAEQDLGAYFVIDASRNIVLWKEVDLEQFGREVGALKEYEELCRKSC